MRFFSLALFCCLVLAACGPASQLGAEEPPPIDPELLVPCRADAFQTLIGQTEEDLRATLILGPVRIIRPGDAVTMDFREERLNIALDGAGRVVRVYCG
ncbi:MAG: I78 family peptidase inhibitor [Pseudomonadota bacterium]